MDIRSSRSTVAETDKLKVVCDTNIAGEVTYRIIDKSPRPGTLHSRMPENRQLDLSADTFNHLIENAQAFLALKDR